MDTTENIKIFLVDDDKMFARALKHSLTRNKIYPLEIMTFPTGEECIQNLRKHNPKIIILDYILNKNFPGAIDGIRVLMRIKQISPDSEVIMLSSQESIDIAMNTINYGAYSYVTKGRNTFIKIKNIITDITTSVEFYENIKKENKRVKRTEIFIFICIFTLFYLLSKIL